MAFAITNLAQLQTEFEGLPAAHYTTADQTGTLSNANLSVAGLKFLRARIRVKGFGADNTNVSFKIGVMVTSGNTPETVITTPTYAATSSTDTGINIEAYGWSNAGFQYVTVTPTTATGAITYDIMLDAV